MEPPEAGTGACRAEKNKIWKGTKKMELPLIFQKQFKNTVDRILHVPGNQPAGNLEMAVVIDCSLPAGLLRGLLPDLLGVLKMHNEIFRNVRLNVVTWKSDREIQNKISPMALAGLSGYYEDYREQPEEKSFEKLVEYLKMYQARAKLILLLTDGNYVVEHEDLLEHFMQPFLDKKLLQIICARDGTLSVRYRFTRIVPEESSGAPDSFTYPTP